MVRTITELQRILVDGPIVYLANGEPIQIPWREKLYLRAYKDKIEILAFPEGGIDKLQGPPMVIATIFGNFTVVAPSAIEFATKDLWAELRDHEREKEERAEPWTELRGREREKEERADTRPGD